MSCLEGMCKVEHVMRVILSEAEEPALPWIFLRGLQKQVLRLQLTLARQFPFKRTRLFSFRVGRFCGCALKSQDFAHTLSGKHGALSYQGCAR